MPKSAPYQPLFLRLIHGLGGILAIGAIITGFWVYDMYDKRFGNLSLPQLSDSQGIHGTFGLFFLLVSVPLAIYSFHWGQKRLIQSDWASRTSRDIGQPIWWITLHRMTNTLMLLATAFAVFTGRTMKEEWLPAGELHHIWYNLHLLGWVLLVLSLLLHILMAVKVGGTPLLLSMVSVRYRPDDSPKLWISRLRQLWKRS